MEHEFHPDYSGAPRDNFFDAVQRELLAGVAEAHIARAKETLGTQFPEQRKLIECIFGLHNFLLAQKNKARDRTKIQEMMPEERREFFKKFSEYRFLLTHFITHEHDLYVVRKFWDTSTAIAAVLDTTKELERLQRSILTHVAGYKILELLGQSPVLASPTEDALGGIDAWVGNDTAVQVEGKHRAPRFKRTDSVFLLASETNDRSPIDDIRRATPPPPSSPIMKIARYAQSLGRDMRVLEMRFPYSMIDNVTGAPSPELVDFFRQQMSG